MHTTTGSRAGRLSRGLTRALFFVPTVVAMLGLALSSSQAQTGIDLQQLQQQLPQIQGQLGGSGVLGGMGGNSTVIQGQQPDMSVQNYNPDVPQVPLPPSRLEQILSARTGIRLTQFGYDQLGQGRSVAIAQTGAVQDDYVLGPGDQIIVSLRGQENSDIRAAVDRNGQVLLPRLKPLAAAGRSFGSFRQDLQSAIHRAYVATEAAVSVATVRQIRVLVSGEVNNPGQRTMSGLASVVDALLLSGGVRKTGSLRSIRIQRGGHIFNVDLYNVLTTGGGGTLPNLADGDRILVPPLGRTVVAAGLVRQPGIYELPAGLTSMPVKTLLSLAGGQEVRGRYRLSVMRILDNGQTAMEALNGEAGVVHDSEALFVQLGADQVTEQAVLSGNTGLAGQYAIHAGMKLSDVLRAPGALGLTPYTLFGIIVRRDPRTYLRNLIAFAPVAVLNGRQDMPLQSDDVIRVFSVNETQMLRFVVRAYLGRIATYQATVRNPLTADIDANAITANSTQLGGNLARFPGIDPNSPARLAAQAQQVDENQFGMDMVSSAPADVQRAQIVALLNVAPPDTDLGQRQNSQFLYQVSQASVSAVPAAPTIPATSTSGTPNNLPQGGGSQASALMSTASGGGAGSGSSPAPALRAGQAQNLANAAQMGMNTNSTFPQDTGLGANYIEQPVIPGGYESNREVHTFGELVRQLGTDPLVLVNFIIDNRARIDGAVGGPGTYLVGPGVTLDDLVQGAGGTANWADQSGVELMTTVIDAQTGRSSTQRQTMPLHQGMLASYMVRPHDQFRFNRVYSDAGLGSVTVQGEVRYSGSYPITRGEHLSDLLARAGGLTSIAYPQGTVYLRKSAAAVERDGYLRAANEIQMQLLVGMTRVGNDKIPPESFTAMQSFVTQLQTQKALGRVTFVADPSVLAAHPEQDPLLESGDTIFIPQRPSTISVLGEVMQPGSYAYQPGAKLEDYLRKAGGYAQFADEGLTFVVMPDGTARKLDRSWLNFSSEKLPPGSSIVVPRDMTPIDTRQMILDITGVLGSLAVSLASLAVISDR